MKEKKRRVGRKPKFSTIYLVSALAAVSHSSAYKIEKIFWQIPRHFTSSIGKYLPKNNNNDNDLSIPLHSREPGKIDIPKASEGRLGVTVFSTHRCNSTIMEALITKNLVHKPLYLTGYNQEYKCVLDRKKNDPTPKCRLGDFWSSFYTPRAGSCEAVACPMTSREGI